jgi:uncharacterized membrane protein
MQEQPEEGGGTEAIIGRVLRIGVAVSLAFIGVGTVISFAGGYGNRSADVARLVGAGGGFPLSASWLITGLTRLDGQAVIVAGLFLLIATPLVRVAVSIITFTRERDRAYAVISALVLLLLLLSFVLGRTG